MMARADADFVDLHERVNGRALAWVLAAATYRQRLYAVRCGAYGAYVMVREGTKPARQAALNGESSCSTYVPYPIQPGVRIVLAIASARSNSSPSMGGTSPAAAFPSTCCGGRSGSGLGR